MAAPSARSPRGETRKYIDKPTGIVHVVTKSQQRLARCRFMMLNLDPERAPLPSKRLKLGRVPQLDQPSLPIYGLSDDSWRFVTVCQSCDYSILGSFDRHNGASNYSIALSQQRRRVAAGCPNAPILCCTPACSPLPSPCCVSADPDVLSMRPGKCDPELTPEPTSEQPIPRVELDRNLISAPARNTLGSADFTGPQDKGQIDTEQLQTIRAHNLTVGGVGGRSAQRVTHARAVPQPMVLESPAAGRQFSQITQLSSSKRSSPSDSPQSVNTRPNSRNTA